MHELRDEAEPTLRELVAHLSPVDLVIVEGFKTEKHPKIEVHRSEVRPAVPAIPAIRTSGDRERCTRRLNAPIPSADLDDIEAIADLVDRFARPFPP